MRLHASSVLVAMSVCVMHPLSVKLSARPPPPLSMLWSGLWGPCWLCLRLGRVSISSLQVCWFFLLQCGCQEVGTR